MRAIKQLRRSKGISQTLLAEAVGVSLRTIQTYEQKDANIPTKNLSKIAAYFDLTIAEMYLQEVNETGETYAKSKTLIKHACTFHPLNQGKYFVQMPLVMEERQKNYIESLAVNKFGNSAFRTGFVIDFIEDGVYRAFEISGDSMNDGTLGAIPNKAIVLGIRINKENLVREGSLAFNKLYVLVCNERIICKKVTGFNPNEKTIQCQNLNSSPEYQDFDLPFSEVLEVFKIVKKQF